VLTQQMFCALLESVYSVRISRGSWPCVQHVIFYLCDIYKE